MADTTTWTPISAPTDFQDDAVFEVDFKTKTVQVLVEQPIVAGENLSQFIKFQAPRFYDAIDLTEMMVNILYVSPAGNKGISAAVNTEYSDDMIRCGWLVPYAACPQKGTLHFILEFVGADYTLKTTIANTPVLDSINDEDVVPEPAEQAWYIALQDNVSVTLQAAQTALGRIESIFNALSTPVAASDASEMQNENTIYVYTGSETGYTYGDWYYYDGTTWVSGGEYASTALLVDDTLSRAGQAADAKAVGDAIDNAVGDVTDDIAGLKQDIIDGRVTVSTGGDEQSFTSDYFRKGIINLSTGNINGNSQVRVNVDGTNKLLYGMAYSLNGVDIVVLPTTTIAISSTGTAYIFVVAYDKNDTDYTGYIGYYTGSGFEKPAVGLVADTQYIDLAALATAYPDYRFKLMVVDTSTADPLDIPTVAAKVSHTEPSEQGYRQLVKTVNNIAPDNSGNIDIDLSSIEDDIADITDDIEDIQSAIADIGDVTQDIDNLKQEIIDGRVTKSSGGQHSFTSDYFRKGIINPSTGNINGNSTVRVNVDGTNKLLYGMSYSTNGVDVIPLPDTITSISSSGTVYIFVSAFDKNDTDYTGYVGYYNGTGFDKPVGLVANLQTIDMSALATAYPDYKFKLMVCDTSTTDPLDIPTTAPKVSYTAQSAEDYRQLVKTVNNIAPDSDGNIEIDAGGVTEVTAIYRFENGRISENTGNDSGVTDPNCLRSIMHCRIHTEKFTINIKVGYKIKVLFYDSTFTYLSHTDYKSATSADITEELTMQGAWIRISMWKVSGDEISIKEGHENLSITYTESESDARNDVNAIASEYLAWGMFPTLGVIGDSFAYGTGSFAWSDVVAKRNGLEYAKYASGGFTTRMWLDAAQRGLAAMLADTPKHLYLINLGINDKNAIDRGDEALGSLSDIDLEDYTQNPDTFYGNYGRIIGNVQTHSPKAKIIIMSVARQTERSMDVHVKAIADKCGLPYIQLTDNPYFDSGLFYSSFYALHPTTYGYTGMAMAIDRLVRKCIVNNLWYFGGLDGSLT